MQLCIILSVLTAILASTSTVQSIAKPQVQVQEILQDNDTAPSNGSLEAILQELDLYDVNISTRFKRSSRSCYHSGQHGGGGGGAYHELLDNCHATVKRVLIRCGVYVDGIQFTYKLSNGRTHIGAYRGGHGGNQFAFDVNVNGGEKIIAIFGKYGTRIDHLAFITNRGIIHGPFGGNGGGYFKANNCIPRGMVGRSGGGIDAIGFYCSHF